MSAYVLDRENFVKIAGFLAMHGESGPIGNRWLHVCHPDVQALKNGGYYLTAAEAVNILIMGNIESVAYRYNAALDVMQLISDRDLFPRGFVPNAVDLFGILRSLQYQSCERDDYQQSVAYAVLIQVLWRAAKVAADQANAPAWA